MSSKILLSHAFQRAAKKLAKKYPSLKRDLANCFDELGENPQLGISLGRNCYKLRLAITSKGRGKSGGARVITYFHPPDGPLILLSIFDKSEQETISDGELASLIELANTLLDDL